MLEHHAGREGVGGGRPIWPGGASLNRPTDRAPVSAGSPANDPLHRPVVLASPPAGAGNVPRTT